ncbi:recombinase family protein [Klebsiella sp. R445]
MSRLFAYCRVSTSEQTTENQILAIKAAGHTVIKSRVVSETISGATLAMDRPLFAELVNSKMEAGDTLVVLKLDRLGRNNIDVQTTVSMLLEKGITVICLDLPVPNLASSEGKLMLQLFASFAEFERNRIRERTMEGLARAEAEGRKGGRPAATKRIQAVKECKAEGMSQNQTAKHLGCSLRTVASYWND